MTSFGRQQFFKTQEQEKSHARVNEQSEKHREGIMSRKKLRLEKIEKKEDREKMLIVSIDHPGKTLILESSQHMPLIPMVKKSFSKMHSSGE